MSKLTQNEIASLYSRGNVFGASSLGLVVALYDTILRDLRRADEAINHKNIETRTFELNHALQVIAELENVLDYQHGGAVAKRLQQFYKVTRGMILNAGIHNSREEILRLIELFSTMRQAWHEADKKTNGAASSPPSLAAQTSTMQMTTHPPQPLRSAATAFSAADSTEAPRGNWSA